MEIRALRTPGLGDASYVLVVYGTAIVVDPQRDIDRFLDVVGTADLRLVLETHIHNDYVSGGRSLAAVSGAELVLPAAAGAAFPHVPAFHLEDLVAGPIVVRPIHTPGHTPEHTSYLILVEDEPMAIFSGGSLLVGGAGRTDLLGPARAAQLARLQHGSVHRLASLPGPTGLYPTHGEGSFCVASGGGGTVSTVGAERRSNPVFAYPDVESFVAGELSGLQPYPLYYSHMGPTNLLGPEPLRRPDIPRLQPSDLDTLLEAAVVDLRPRRRFAAGHIPGSLGVELRDDFAVWVGWIVPFGTPLVLVSDPGQDVGEAVVQLARIGYDDVRGHLVTLDDWDCEGRPLDSFRVADADELLEAWRRGEVVLDVRAPNERQAVALPGTIHRYVPDLLDGIAFDPARQVWVACATGFRASIAASLLKRAGFEPIVLGAGGVADLVARSSVAAVS